MSPGHYPVSGQARKAHRNYRTFSLRSTTETTLDQSPAKAPISEAEVPVYGKPAYDTTLCWIGILALLMGLILILNLIVHAVQHCDATVVV
ncbi:hypothetical protein [Lewinella sp. W8]|uniref:hypothetical protein n=1 Tax=Lewinella sp. W8 TaxID=2528208 RepID=UPI0010673836|nr:hypothetical protein [Lewinella sp. W8]MTB52559.1 hypothetical protein [Lewinella sp. W8]